MLKHIKAAGVLLCLTLSLLTWGIIQNGKQVHSLSRGSYFFSKTRDHAHIAQIAITFPDSSVISIEKKDDLWRIKEADDYYAAFSKVNALVELIRNTTIYRADKLQGDDSNTFFDDAIKIKSMDDNGDIIDSAVIAPRRENNKYHYAIRGNDHMLYQLSGNFVLSSNRMDWVQMPLLTFNNKQIRRIKTDTFEVYRRFPAENFKSVKTGGETPHIKGLIDSLWYLSAEDVCHAVNFKTESYKKIKNYEITLFGGAIYLLDIYNSGDDYWLSIRLNKAKLLSDDTAKKLIENSILYDGWFFQIDKDKGAIISGFVL